MDNRWRNGSQENRAEAVPLLRVLAKGDPRVANGNVEKLEVGDAGE